jgi:hypothetical protein
MSAGLQVLNQQPFRSFQRNRQDRAVAGEFGVQIGQSRDIVGDPQLGQPLAAVVEDAQLVVAAAPIDPGERRPLLRFHRFVH